MNFNKMLQKTREISFIVGPIVIAVVGILFMILSDLGMKNTASWLMGAVLLTFGSAIVCFFSEIKKENIILVYVLKGIGLLLAVGFIVYLGKFMNSEVCTKIKANDVFSMNYGKITISCLSIKNFLNISSIVLTSVGLTFQVLNIGLNIYLGIKE